MKKLFLILVSLCSIAISANAQHYNEILLFIEVGKTIDEASSIIYLHFDSDGNMYHTSMSKSTAQDKYANGTLEEYGVNQSHKIERDYSVDSSNYKVYSRDRYTQSFGVVGYNYYYGTTLTTPQYGYTSDLCGKDYYAIEYGSYGYIEWYVPKNSSEIRNKKYYKRIQPSELKRKAPDYEFLN